MFYFHLTVLYLYVFYLNGLGKVQEEVFEHAKLTFYNQLGSVIHLSVVLEELGLWNASNNKFSLRMHRFIWT